MLKRTGMAVVGVLLVVLVLGSFSLFTEGCGDKSPAAPVTQIVYATPPPDTLAGRDWTYATLSAGFSSRGYMGGTVFNDRIWVTGGYYAGFNYNDVWSSANGSDWTQNLSDNASPASTQFTQRASHVLLSFNSKMWIIGGQNSASVYPLNDVWSSSDGATWSQILSDNGSPGSNQFSRRHDHCALVYNNKMWVIGGDASTGFRNDVWSSSDGVTWTQVLSDNASPGSDQFSQRDQFAALVYGGKMWVIGGQDGGGRRNDVWSSSDGSTWTQVLSDSASLSSYQFPQRFGHQSFVFGNAMWVVGGGLLSGPANDVWYSTDGSTWTQMTASSSFPVRYDFVGLVCHNAMWVIGGAGSGPDLNDVWYSPF